MLLGHVREFGKTQCHRSKYTGVTTFRDLVFPAATKSSSASCVTDVSSALSVMGSLIVLADGHIFEIPGLLKVVMRSLQSVRYHRHTSIRALHSFVWRCLVWSFAKIPRGGQQASSRHSSAEGEQGFRDKVFAVIRQDGRRGVRSALVYALLGTTPLEACSSDPPDDNDVLNAISVVRSLVDDSDEEARTEGTALLRQLTSAIGNPGVTCRPDDYDPNRILATSLLDGRLVDVEPRDIHTVVQAMQDFEPGFVRPLSEAEVDSYWDSLVSVWETALKHSVQERQEMDLHVRPTPDTFVVSR